MEWVAGTYLAQDKVAAEEIWGGLDSHEDNRVKFGLPSRLISKVFLFRLVFGGTAYSYSVDPDFASVGFSQKKWQLAIDAFYRKYVGWAEWHKGLMQEATTTGKIILSTGREFEFSPSIKRGEPVWPRTTILNYPVQSTAADLMVIARISLRNRMRKLNLKSLLICTVHDSIVIDCPDDEYKLVCKLCHEVFRDIPANFEKLFGHKFNLPMRCEVLYGKTLGTMEEFKV